MFQPIDFFPSRPTEQAVYLDIWKHADPGGKGEIGGAHAVNFLRKSGLAVPVLREIWSLCTPLPSMNENQFYVALRFISMAQNGETSFSKGLELTCSFSSISIVNFHLALSYSILSCLVLFCLFLS